MRFNFAIVAFCAVTFSSYAMLLLAAIFAATASYIYVIDDLDIHLRYFIDRMCIVRECDGIRSTRLDILLLNLLMCDVASRTSIFHCIQQTNVGDRTSNSLRIHLQYIGIGKCIVNIESVVVIVIVFDAIAAGSCQPFLFFRGSLVWAKSK